MGRASGERLQRENHCRQRWASADRHPRPAVTRGPPPGRVLPGAKWTLTFAHPRGKVNRHSVLLFNRTTNHDRRVNQEAFPPSLSRVGGFLPLRSSADQRTEATMGSEPVKAGEFKLEIVVIPVS